MYVLPQGEGEMFYWYKSRLYCQKSPISVPLNWINSRESFEEHKGKSKVIVSQQNRQIEKLHQRSHNEIFSCFSIFSLKIASLRVTQMELSAVLFPLYLNFLIS